MKLPLLREIRFRLNRGWVFLGLLCLFVLPVVFPTFLWAREPVPFSHLYQDGYVLLIWNERVSDSEIESTFLRLKAAGAQHLTLPFFGCQTNLKSTDVGSCQVRSIEFSIHLAERAIANGFRVSLLPILVTQDWEWRGFFEPHDVKAWFLSYTRWILEIAKEAERLGTEEFVVGSEFSRLNRYEQQWESVVRAVRNVFKGPLILTVNWDEPERGFWDSVDAIGVSAYFPLSERVNPTQEELDSAWLKRRESLTRLSQRWQRPLYFTELGYFNASSAARTPWAPHPGDLRDEDLQARCFKAFKKAWGDVRELARFSVWSVHPEGAGFYGDPGLSGPRFVSEILPSITDNPLGNPAEKILRELFLKRLNLLPLRQQGG